MLTTAIIAGFILLTLLLVSLRWPVIAFALAAPAAYLCYFLFINEIKETLGYPVEINLVEQTKAIFLYGTETADGVYILVREDGKDHPRLIRYEKSTEMREKLNELNKRKGIKRIKVGKDKFATTPGDVEGKAKGKLGDGKLRKGKKGAQSDGVTNKTDGLAIEEPENMLPEKTN